MFKEIISTPGDHTLRLQGKVGALESIVNIPQTIDSNLVALLGHPHSLQGGTMNNKVVTTMARAFKELGIPSLRFNFRGVGMSEGVYDAGLGESEDMKALANQWLLEDASIQFILAGFSFGAYVTYLAAKDLNPKLLISIAPPVHHYEFETLKTPHPWLIVQGDEDELVAADLVSQFAKNCSPSPEIIHFPETGHFFHGKLVALKAQVIQWIQKTL